MKKNGDRYIFLGFGVWFLLITLIGFGPSFYFRNDTEELPFHLILHGIVFTLWILLFLTQTSLIFSKNVKLHMTLGIVGLILIIFMIPIGSYPVLYKVSIGTKTIDHAGHNLFGLYAGFIFFFLGFFFRKKAFYHKRFMVFATIMFTAAAMDRVAFALYMENSLLFRKGLTLLPALIIFLIDLYTRKKIIVFDLLPVIVLMGIYYLADFFWMSTIGENIMKFLAHLV